MDRNLREMQRAFEQQINLLRRDVDGILARVGSATIIAANATVIYPGTLGPHPGPLVPAALLSVTGQPGRWFAIASARFTASMTAGHAWFLGGRLYDRATGAAIPMTSPTGVAPAATWTAMASTTADLTMTAFGWFDVEPTEHPDGFNFSFDISSFGPTSWPTVYEARVALLPF